MLQIIKLNQFTKNKILTEKIVLVKIFTEEIIDIALDEKVKSRLFLFSCFKSHFRFLAIFKLEMKSGQNKCQSNWTFLLWSFTSERNNFFQVYWVSSSISCLPKNVLNAFSFPLREKERLFSLHCRGKKCRHCTFFLYKNWLIRWIKIGIHLWAGNYYK